MKKCINTSNNQLLFKIFIIFILLLNTSMACALEKKIRGNEFKELKERLVKDGFSENSIKKIYDTPRVTFALKGVSAFFVHSEGSLNYDQFLSKKSILNASKYMKTHKKELEKAQKEYGVDKSIVTAIMLVETRLGKYLGNKNVINTLSTMSTLSEKSQREALWKFLSSSSKRMKKEKFDKKADKKSEWAYDELKALLKFAAREKIDPTKITGSYAGAMGISQFMPSNALNLAKDGNKDGKVDLFNHTDAIHSIANYLKNFGWKSSLERKEAHKVLYKYNHSNYYVNTLLKISDRLKG